MYYYSLHHVQWIFSIEVLGWNVDSYSRLVPTCAVLMMWITDSERQCSVCMEDFQLQDVVRSLPCHHLFHTDCINPWLHLVNMFTYWDIIYLRRCWSDIRNGILHHNGHFPGSQLNECQVWLIKQRLVVTLLVAICGQCKLFITSWIPIVWVGVQLDRVYISFSYHWASVGNSAIRLWLSYR